MPRTTNDTTVTACDLAFYDTGGPNGSYGQNENKELTVLPDGVDNAVLVEFGTMTMNTNDTLFVYDGLSASDPLLGAFTGTATPPNVEATNAQGALTFVFKSKTAVVAGWSAGLHCVSNAVTSELSASAFLLGAYDESTEQMKDKLRSTGVLPSTDPYAAMSDFTQVNDATSYAMDAGVMDVTGTTAIVDWIWVELRSKSDNTVVITSRPALLRADGQIVDMDGTSDITLNAVPDDYFVVIRHRNHLGIMSATAQPLNATSTPTVDFKKETEPTYGTNARKGVGSSPTVMCMWPGDANGDRKVAAVGAASDVTPVTQMILTDVAGNPNSSLLYSKTGYYRADLNMDGKVAMVGSTTEVTTITVNVLTHDGNPSQSILLPITEQLPE